MLQARVLIEDTTKLTNEEWRAQRQIGIGGSDAAVAAGLSDWKSPRELWAEKVAEELPEEKMSDAMWFGIEMEPIVAKRFAEEHKDFTVEEVNKILRHPDDKYEFAIANLDRLVTLPDGRQGVLEIKTATAFNQSKWEDDQIPPQYVCQVQHYLAVTGLKFAWVAALVGSKYYERFVERDDKFIEMLLTEEAKFWECVKSKTPPAWDGSEASNELLKDTYDTVNGDEVELDEECKQAFERYFTTDDKIKEINKTIKELTQIRDAQKQTILAKVGNAALGKVGDYQVKRSMVMVKAKDAYEYPKATFKRIA